MAVAEQQHVPVDERTRVITRSRAGCDVVDRLAADDPVGEQRPSGPPLLNLGAGQSLVLAVVPLDEIRIDDRTIREAGEVAGLSRALQWD